VENAGFYVACPFPGREGMGSQGKTGTDFYAYSRLLSREMLVSSRQSSFFFACGLKKNGAQKIDKPAF